ncbi:MAG TPA: S41 family peptidase [Phnomibacter sp.]|nr:S41 family peptidase [Phnomibacter sp.]
MKKNTLQVWLPLLFGIVLALGILTGFQLAESSGRSTIGASIKSRSGLQEVLDLLQYKYVDEVHLDSLETDGIYAILNQLDPHTVFIPPQELGEANADLEGGFSGIGVEYQMINDTMNVVYVIENGPSAKAGLQAGDQIVKVYDKDIAGKKLKGTELRKLLRGDYNTEVEVTALRNGKPGSYKIVRGNIPLPSVNAQYMAAPGVGYIRLSKFAETTYREFMDAATQLQKQGMKKMILDLRGNSGGYLVAATNIADELLPDGLAIVSTRGKNVKNADVISSKPGIFEEGPLVVLIDEYSASASEVLAGALQDNDRGTIVGRRSFGKGLVQEQYDLSNGGALRITVARYFTPLGRSIQKPYQNGHKDDYLEEVYGRHRNNDSLAAANASKEIYITKKGKKLLGAGGITPDVLVPFDSTKLPVEVLKLYNSSRINHFSFNIFKENQALIRSYKSVHQFDSAFQLQPNAWNDYLQAARKDSVFVTDVSSHIKSDLLLIIKSDVARYVWRSTGYYQLMQPSDKTLLQAIKTIQTQQ